MKKPPAVLLYVIFLLLCVQVTQAQSFGTNASAVWVSNCGQSNFYNTSGSGADLLGPSGYVFDNANLGVHTQNSGTLVLRGAGVKTFKTPGTANVCGARLFYRIYLQSGSPGSFNFIDLPLLSNCNTGTGQFPNGAGPCVDGDQLWQRVISDGTTVPYAPVNLTSFAPGNYVLEVYYDVAGSNSSASGCSDNILLDNGGNFYKANFSIQSPFFASNNPVTCNGSEGFITISGLVPGVVYSVSYTDDGVQMGPITLTASASGQIVITGLNAGLYSNFAIQMNGCTTNLFMGIVLANPIFISTFTQIPPFCEGNTAPVLPTTSNNGITGTWSPAVVNNTASGTYNFTPDGGQCGISATMTITVIPKTIPSFPFGTTLNICAGGTVPILPGTSDNGITGTWNPGVVDDQNSVTYTFTPDAGQCAATATFNVTVDPNFTPTFSFGTSLSICAGDPVPSLPGTSTNGIIGTWSPAVVNDQNSGSYTFTPDAGQCAVPASFSVTVNPIITPLFSFGSTMNICAGGTVPSLQGTSDNGITGTWNPAMVDDQNSGTYTFTPDPGQCATTASFSVIVDSNITPTFSFGTSLSICADDAVPTLPGTSDNGITGTWSSAVVDDQNSGTYTFTPDPGQCAVPASLSVTVNPNITPTFSFGNSLTICAGDAVPTLPWTSTNGITGTWSPSVIDNQNSGSYTFTPDAGQCAVPASLSVSVNPVIIPVFSIGNSLTICSGESVPVLSNTSDNGITGTWNPTVVDNQNSSTYTFIPDAGQQSCIVNATFSVTVNPIITPSFSFGTSQSICVGATVPLLVNTSLDGINGTWSPAAIDNQNSGTYTFTPNTGECAMSATLNVDVNPVPSMTIRPDTVLNDGDIMPEVYFSGSPTGISFVWTNSMPIIGLAESGVGFVPQFRAINNSNDTITATITVTPSIGGCSGTPVSYRIKVRPLNKDIFVPNVFSPNGDGKNDRLFVYGNYIEKLEMRIFNQWGEQILFINSPNQGWDGTFRGKPQPVGVYVYVLNAELAGGRKTQLKGSIILVR